MGRLQFSLREILAAVTGLSIALAATLFTPPRFRDFASFLCALALLILLLRGSMARRRALRYFCEGASFPQVALVCYSVLKIQRLLPKSPQEGIVRSVKDSTRPFQGTVSWEVWVALGRPRYEYEIRLWLTIALVAIAGAAWLFCRTYWKQAASQPRTGIGRYAQVGLRETIFLVAVAIVISCATCPFDPPLWFWEAVKSLGAAG